MKPHPPAYYASTYEIPLGVVLGFLKHSETHAEVMNYIYHAWILESKGRVGALKSEEAP